MSERLPLIVARRTGRDLAMTLAVVFSLGAEANADNSCRGGESFSAWLSGVRQEAAGVGLSDRTLSALDGLTFDDRVLKAAFG